MSKSARIYTTPARRGRASGASIAAGPAPWTLLGAIRRAPLSVGSLSDGTWQIGPQTRHQKEPRVRCISYAG